MAKSSKAQVTKRREEVQKMIVSGAHYQTICKEMAEKWETSKRAIQDDIRLVNKEWQEAAEESKQLLRNKNKERLELLFHSAILKEQYKAALEIQKEINKLDGLYKEVETEEKQPEIIKIGRKSDLKVVGEE